MVQIELLVVPDCPHEAPAAELITTAVADTGVQAKVTRTVITSQDQAWLRGSDPFAEPGAPTAMACRLYPTPDGLRGVPTLRDLRQELKREAETDVS
jgi:hypothetical protein